MRRALLKARSSGSGKKPSNHRKEVGSMEWITAIVQGNPLTTAIVAGLSVLYVAGKKLIEIYKDYKLKGGK